MMKIMFHVILVELYLMMAFLIRKMIQVMHLINDQYNQMEYKIFNIYKDQWYSPKLKFQRKGLKISNKLINNFTIIQKPIL